MTSIIRKTKKYYLQRHAGGYVGNSMIWWKEGDHGYSCDLSEAKIFSGDDPDFLITLKHDRGQKYYAWEKEYIDALTTKTVDMQDIDFNKAIRKKNRTKKG